MIANLQQLFSSFSNYFCIVLFYQNRKILSQLWLQYPIGKPFDRGPPWNRFQRWQRGVGRKRASTYFPVFGGGRSQRTKQQQPQRVYPSHSLPDHSQTCKREGCCSWLPVWLERWPMGALLTGWLSRGPAAIPFTSLLPSLSHATALLAERPKNSLFRNANRCASSHLGISAASPRKLEKRPKRKYRRTSYSHRISHSRLLSRSHCRRHRGDTADRLERNPFLLERCQRIGSADATDVDNEVRAIVMIKVNTKERDPKKQANLSRNVSLNINRNSP